MARDASAFRVVDDDDEDHDVDAGWKERLVDGADWLNEGSATPEALWGDGEVILAARKQPTVIAGAQGSGKTTIAGRLMLGALGVDGFDQLLGLPVGRTDRSALYLAADRPDQARLSLRRMVDDSEVVRGRMTVWQGPPPYDLARRPSLLLEMAEAADASMLVVDSLKDVALKLSDDEVGSAVNRAIQHCVAQDVDVLSLHHPRKLSGEDSDAKPRKLDDLYGSTWLTSGAGSVLYLFKSGKGNLVELGQLKTPIGREFEATFRHDLETGDVVRTAGARAEVFDVIDDAGHDGVTLMHVARCVFDTEEPSDAQRKKVKRAIDALLEQSRVVEVPGVSRANGAGMKYRSVVL